MASSASVQGTSVCQGISDARSDPSLCSLALLAGRTPHRPPCIGRRGVMQHGQGFALLFIASQAGARQHLRCHCWFSCKEKEWEGVLLRSILSPGFCGNLGTL